jgi:chromosome segregation ATPase
MQVAGAFNPYEAGNRRVISLELRATELQRQVAETRQSIADLIAEQDQLRVKLERGGAPCRQLFKPERPIPKHLPRQQRPDPGRCMTALEQLIRKERDDAERDVLVCCHDLLTGRDRPAIDLFALFLDPKSSPSDVEQLQDQLLDRDTHAAILVEQVKNLSARHRFDREVYVELQQRLDGHVVDESPLCAKLREQISALDSQIAQIAPCQADVVSMLEAIAKSKQEVDVARIDAAKAAETERSGQRELTEADARLAGIKAAVGELKKRNEKLESSKRAKEEQLGIAKGNKEQALDELARRKAALNDANEHIELVRGAGVETADHVAEIVAVTSRGGTVASFLADLDELEERAARRLADYKELKRQCRDQKRIQKEITDSITKIKAMSAQFRVS